MRVSSISQKGLLYVSWLLHLILLHLIRENSCSKRFSILSSFFFLYTIYSSMHYSSMLCAKWKEQSILSRHHHGFKRLFTLKTPHFLGCLPLHLSLPLLILFSSSFPFMIMITEDGDDEGSDSIKFWLHFCDNKTGKKRRQEKGAKSHRIHALKRLKSELNCFLFFSDSKASLLQEECLSSSLILNSTSSSFGTFLVLIVFSSGTMRIRQAKGENSFFLIILRITFLDSQRFKGK